MFNNFLFKKHQTLCLPTFCLFVSRMVCFQVEEKHKTFVCLFQEGQEGLPLAAARCRSLPLAAARCRSKKRRPGFFSERQARNQVFVSFKRTGAVQEGRTGVCVFQKNRCSSSLFKKTRCCSEKKNQKKNHVVSC